MGELREQRRLHLFARPRLLAGARESEEPLALDGQTQQERAGLCHALARLQAARHQDSGPLETDGDREVDVGAAELRRVGRGISLAIRQLGDLLPERRSRRCRAMGEISMVVGEEDGHLLAEQRGPEAIRRHAEQRLAVRVGQEPLGQLRQSDQVPALGLEQAEAPAGERGEPADQQPRHQKHEERRDVARVGDRQGVEGREKEKVEGERREDRGEHPGAALPDRRAQEDGQQEEQRDR